MKAFAKAAGRAVLVGMLVGLTEICVGAEALEGNAAEAPAAKVDPGDFGKASTLTLDVKDAKLATVLAEIAEQSGNRLIGVDADVTPKPVTIKFDKTPYWEALDKLCGQQGLTYQANPDAGDLILVPAPAGDVKTSYAGPVVFKLTSVSPAGKDDAAAYAGKARCTVVFFWEDRLTPTAFRPMQVTKVTDAADKPCELPHGIEMTVGKMNMSGGYSGGRMEVLGGAFGGKFSVWLARGAEKADASFAEISGTFGLVASAGKVELRIENALVDVEQSVENTGYKLTVSKVERRGDVATLTVALTKDGNPVEVPWPGRGGWSLVDAKGNAIEGILLGGRLVRFALPAGADGPYALLRTYVPDLAEATYQFKFEHVPFPK